MNAGATYQLKAVLRGISPMIWRRLQLATTTTIADLHHILQIAFTWDDFHLHRFHIHGRDYGVAYPGGMHFRDDPNQVCLGDFSLRVGERFWYEYNFFASWVHNLRIEQIRPAAPPSVPTCIAGARAAPPESCNGPQAFLALRQHYTRPHLLTRFAELMTACPPDREQVLQELPIIAYWLDIDRFPRRRVNQRLAQYAAGDDAWLEA